MKTKKKLKYVAGGFIYSFKTRTFPCVMLISLGNKMGFLLPTAQLKNVKTFIRKGFMLYLILRQLGLPYKSYNGFN